jgi:transcriptional regulator with XRE-family HTH domain
MNAGASVSAEKGSWLKYQLELSGYSLRDVSRESRRSPQMITEYIKGRKGSDAVSAAIARMLSLHAPCQDMLRRADLATRAGLRRCLRERLRRAEFCALKSLLERKKITYQRISDLPGISENQIYLFANGQSRGNFRVRQALASLLGYPSWEHLYLDIQERIRVDGAEKEGR